MSTLNETPHANRVHIGFFGKRNSGKSSLINALTGQSVAIVSDVPGTTTDPVFKAMEIHGIGPCVLIDTAGFDDVGELGKMRVEKTALAAEKTDIAVILFSGEDIREEAKQYKMFCEKNIPALCVISKTDTLSDPAAYAESVRIATGAEPLLVCAGDPKSIRALKDKLIQSAPEEERPTIVAHLVKEGDSVLLVMPQDIQAPKGRLILPQVQTLRELLDKKCLVTCVTTDKLDEALSALTAPPKLIVTDSQVFKTVYEKKPPESLLTSFSVLFAGYKGDLDYYVQGAAAIDALTESSRVLIAECCTHAPLTEDIGREKLPRLLRARVGQALAVDMVSGSDFPEDLSGYDLIIQCGACMFNRRYVMSRINRAKAQDVPMTNYGVAIAYLNGILDKITLA